MLRKKKDNHDFLIDQNVAIDINYIKFTNTTITPQVLPFFLLFVSRNGNIFIRPRESSFCITNHALLTCSFVLYDIPQNRYNASRCNWDRPFVCMVLVSNRMYVIISCHITYHVLILTKQLQQTKLNSLLRIHVEFVLGIVEFVVPFPCMLYFL